MSLTVGSKVSEFGVDFSPVLNSNVTFKELKGYLEVNDDVRGVVVLKDRSVCPDENECIYYRIEDRLARRVFALFEKKEAFSDQEVIEVQEFLLKMILTAKHCREKVAESSADRFSADLIKQTNTSETWVGAFRIPVVEGKYHIATQELKPTSKLSVAQFRQFAY